jgi:hypothetical protein
MTRPRVEAPVHRRIDIRRSIRFTAVLRDHLYEGGDVLVGRPVTSLLALSAALDR